LSLLEAAAELDTGAMKEPTGIESSVGTVERLCKEVGDLLAKVRSMLAHVRDMSIPDSISDTMAGILKALAVKPDGEDPLVAAVRRQVTIGSESIFSIISATPPSLEQAKGMPIPMTNYSFRGGGKIVLGPRRSSRILRSLRFSS
jgi:hypothetical protein